MPIIKEDVNELKKELEKLVEMSQSKHNVIMDERFMNYISYLMALAPKEQGLKLNDLFSPNVLGEKFDEKFLTEIKDMLEVISSN